ncbi:CPBP family intramembrane metalloprotease [Cognatishimia sp. SS12]|uniref:CPBP family intramembrane glutamic endopeptidase n=1 Tax=Cognatishimia sp. SS12 TaxID=2979465 RepID=UPI00232C886F|nr:CPBP family intramembrane glutamic endopeptidase [Cognatishimia sp. SS12]MDC0737571.1 CPBP family intramembrane metalloprotease [Cognatishimia sp. SS12]
MSRYQNHQQLIDPARASAGVPRLLLGFLCLMIASTALNLALVQILRDASEGSTLMAELRDGTSARAVLITLFAFLAPAAALWVVTRLVHRRSILGLVGPLRIAFRDFFKVLRPALVLVAVVFILPTPEALKPQFHMGFASWLLLLPLGLAAIFVQISTEELIFRGYLQSQLAARFAHPVVWLAVPSVLFGLLHYAPGTYGDNAILVAVWATAFGVIAADLTARAGNLGPALALHFVNNVASILIMSFYGYWDGLALLHVGYGPGDTDILRMALVIELPFLLCFWLVGRIAIRR